MKYFSEEKKFFVALAAYAFLHFCFRIFISNSLEKDEAEMILYTQQHLAWGYNSQPPLYVWLQLAFFRLFGLGVPALALLKNSLIFLFYFFLYRSAKMILANTTKAIISTTSLLLVYNFSWIMHKDLTHSVLLAAICSITFYLLLKAFSTKQTSHYILLGACIGLGLMTKYNYAIFIVALIAAAFSVPSYRQAIVNKKILLSATAALIISSGHFSWCLANPELLTSDIGDFQPSDASRSFLGTKGLLELLEQSLLFIAPLLVIYLAFFPRIFLQAFKKIKERKDISALLGRFFLFAFLLIIVLIVLGNVGKVKARWLAPILFLIPLYFFTRVQEHPIGKKRKIFFLSIIVLCAVATLFSVWGRIILADARGKYSRLNYPYSTLSKMIKQEGFEQGLIVAEDQVIAANLKIHFNDSLVIVARSDLDIDMTKYFENVLVIWEDHLSDSYTEAIGEWLAYHNLDGKQPIKKQALYKYSKNNYYHLNMFIIKNINI